MTDKNGNDPQTIQDISDVILNFLRTRPVREKTLEEISAVVSDKLALVKSDVKTAINDLVKKRKLTVSTGSVYECTLKYACNFVEVSVCPKSVSHQNTLTRNIGTRRGDYSKNRHVRSESSIKNWPLLLHRTETRDSSHASPRKQELKTTSKIEFGGHQPIVQKKSDTY